MTDFTSEDIWKVVDLFFKSNNMAQPQLESFNDFVNNSLTQIARDAAPICVDVEPKNKKDTGVQFSRVTMNITKIEPAQQYSTQVPNDCRLQNQSYFLNFKCSLEIKAEMYDENDGTFCVGRNLREDNVQLCPLPILLNSEHCHLRQNVNDNPDVLRVHRVREDECPFDEGGYFIINGSEKSLIGSEVNRSNRITVLPGPDSRPDELVDAKVVSSVPDRALYSKVDVKLKLERHTKQPMLYISQPAFDGDYPLLAVMLALYPNDHPTEQDILRLISPENNKEIIEIAQISLKFAEEQYIGTPALAVDYMCKNFRPNVQQATQSDDDEQLLRSYKQHLATRFLPHIGTDVNSNYDKCCYLGYMANLCIQCYLKRRGYDDRDHWGSKRLQMTGSLLHDLFRRCFGDFEGQMAQIIQRKKLTFIGDDVEVNRMMTILKGELSKTAQKTLTRQIVGSIANGNWRTGRPG